MKIIDVTLENIKSYEDRTTISLRGVCDCDSR